MPKNRLDNLPLTDMTLRQLRRVALALGVSRYVRMRKEQLLASILEKQGAVDRQTLTEMINEAVAAEPAPGTYEDLVDVDDVLLNLPDDYRESRIFLLNRDPQWAYAYWDIPSSHKDELRSQGGQQLALRLYDVTDLDINTQTAHNIQEYPCDETTREFYLPLPLSNRDYIIEIGYRTWDDRWLVLARSNSPYEKFIESIRSNDELVRKQALINASHSNNQLLIPALCALLESDPNPEIRSLAATAIGKIAATGNRGE
jgi:uncharacterized protein